MAQKHAVTARGGTKEGHPAHSGGRGKQTGLPDEGKAPQRCPGQNCEKM